MKRSNNLKRDARETGRPKRIVRSPAKTRARTEIYELAIVRVVDRLGERVRLRAVELGLSLGTIASRMGTKPPRLSLLMRTKRITAAMFGRLERALEMGSDDWAKPLPTPRPASPEAVRKRLIRRAIAGLPVGAKKA